MVDGCFQICDWIDKGGNKRRLAEVVANDVYFSARPNMSRMRAALFSLYQSAVSADTGAVWAAAEYDEQLRWALQ